jgi:hypothetical protein
MTMQPLSRRTVLLCAAAPLALAACQTNSTATTGPSPLVPPPATAASDTTLLANALAELETLLPPGNAVLAKAQAAAALVAKDAAAVAAATSPTAVVSTGQEILDAALPVAQGVLGLFPGGGTAVIVAQAILGLLPTFAGWFGLTMPTSTALNFAVRQMPILLPLPLARALLGGLPKSPHLP